MSAETDHVSHNIGSADFRWWKRLVGAFLESANLVALSILVVPSILTQDSLLIILGMALEAVYLTCATWSSNFEKRLQARLQHDIDPLDRVLLVVCVAGFVAILFFGFGKHLLSHPRPYLTHAEGWEAGAIIWTGLFLFYYFAKFNLPGNMLWNKLIIIVFSVAGWKLLDLAWHSMKSPLIHVFWVFLISACFLIIDFVIWKKHPLPKEQHLSKTSFYWADVPMVIAFIVLLGYLWMHKDTENPEVFVSGVVACQLLISNSIFVVMEFGLLRPPTTDGA